MPSRPESEGCLISVSRRGAGSGGREGSVGDAAQSFPPGGPSRAVPACQPHVAGPRDGGCRQPVTGLPARPGPEAVDRQPANSQGEAGCLKGTVHRGLCGANLETPRAGRHGLGGLAALGLQHASMLRGIEVRGSEHLVCAHCVNLCAPGTLGVPRALAHFLRGRGCAIRTTACPGPQRTRAMARACLTIASGPMRTTHRARRSDGFT